MLVQAPCKRPARTPMRTLSRLGSSGREQGGQSSRGVAPRAHGNLGNVSIRGCLCAMPETLIRNNDQPDGE